VRVAVEYPVGPADSTVEEAVLARPSDTARPYPVDAPPLEEVVGPEPVAPPLAQVVGAEAVVLLAVVRVANNRYRSKGHGAEAVVLLAVVLVANNRYRSKGHGAEAVVLLAVVFVANNRYRSKGNGYRRCYRCRDRGRYHHPDRCHRYRGDSPSNPSHPSPSRPSHIHPGCRKMRLAAFGNNLCRLSFLSNSFQAPGKMVGQMAPSELVHCGATVGSSTFFHHNPRGIEIYIGPQFGRGSTPIWAALGPSAGTCPPDGGLIA
jgi:hypothetical protein